MIVVEKIRQSKVIQVGGGDSDGGNMVGSEEDRDACALNKLSKAYARQHTAFFICVK